MFRMCVDGLATNTTTSNLVTSLSAPADPALALAEAARALIDRKLWDFARKAVDLALSVDPLQPNAHTLKAYLFERDGEHARALAHWRLAASIAPELPANRFNLALALMGAGALAEGFALQEARLEKADWSSFAALGSFAPLRNRVPRPGQNLASARVLAFTEQGLGDMIWAARFLPTLMVRCGQLDLACPPTLQPLLASFMEGNGSGILLGAPPDRPDAKLNLALLAETCDAFVPLMRLPHMLGHHGANAVWITPAADRVATYRTQFAAAHLAKGPILGVVWAANPASQSATARTFPPDILRGLDGIGGVDARIINLQGGDPTTRAALAEVFPDCANPIADGEPPLDDYAAMIAATDLLITADTMAAHLAGCMGHPAFVAIPALANFYWGPAGAMTPWYPSLRLFRQEPHADWSGVGHALMAAVRHSHWKAR